MNFFKNSRIAICAIAITSIYSSCNYLYSPTGIRGSDARAEIDELKQSTGFISLPILSSSVSSVRSSGQSSNATCTIKTDAISSSNSATSTANITVPSLGSSLDMNHTSGIGYFRTNFFNNLQVGQIVLFRQITGNTGDCRFNYGSAACGTTDITTLTKTNVERENNSRINFDENTANNCLAIQCNAPAAIRLRTTTSGTPTASVEFDTVGFIVSPILFESLTEIKDDRYYTKDSVEACKENINLLSLIGFAETQRAFQAYSAQDALATSCNENNPSFTPPSNLLISVLQGALCSLEEVGFFGVF